MSQTQGDYPSGTRVTSSAGDFEQCKSDEPAIPTDSCSRLARVGYQMVLDGDPEGLPLLHQGVAMDDPWSHMALGDLDWAGHIAGKRHPRYAKIHYRRAVELGGHVVRTWVAVRYLTIIKECTTPEKHHTRNMVHEARRLLEKAARSGTSEAKQILQTLDSTCAAQPAAYRPVEMEKTSNDVVHLGNLVDYTRAAAEGCVKSMYYLAMYYLKWDIRHRDAYHCLRKAADAGHMQATFEFCNRYLNEPRALFLIIRYVTHLDRTPSTLKLLDRIRDVTTKTYPKTYAQILTTHGL